MPTLPSTDRRPIDSRAVAVVMALCFIWGLQQVAIKAAAPEVSTMLQVSVRSALSCLLLLAWNRFVSKEPWTPGVKPFHGFLTGLFFAGEFFFVAEGLRYTSASHMAVLLYTAPLFAAVGLAFKLPEERLSAFQWAGVATSFAGIVLAFGVPALLSGNELGADWLWGDFLGLCSGLSWGLTTITIRTTTMSRASSGQLLFWQLATGFAILFPCAFLMGETRFEPGLVGWSSLLFQIFVVSFASYLIWCGMLRRYLAARLGVLVFATPLFGVVMGVVMLGESVDGWFAAGAALVLAGVVAVQCETRIREFLGLKSA